MSRFSTTPKQPPVKLLKRQEKNVRATVAGEATFIMNRIVKQAKGELEIPLIDEDTKKPVRDANGKITMVPGEMTPMEMKASEIFLRKVLPDLSMVQQVEKDSTDSMSRDELQELLVGMVANNPQLALAAGIDEAMNKAKTVKVIEKDD